MPYRSSAHPGAGPPPLRDFQSVFHLPGWNRRAEGLHGTWRVGRFLGVAAQYDCNLFHRRAQCVEGADRVPDGQIGAP